MENEEFEADYEVLNAKRGSTFGVVEPYALTSLKSVPCSDNTANAEIPILDESDAEGRTLVVTREIVDPRLFNTAFDLPFELRWQDFQMAMQDVYDFFFDVNTLLLSKGLGRLDDTLRPAIMSGLLSDMLTASLANHSRVLTQNTYFNGHPDLVVQGRYVNNSTRSGEEGVEIKTSRKPGGAVDTHGARDQWLCVFVYQLDNDTEPAAARRALRFTELYLAHVEISDFRKNARGELGTRTATLHRDGIQKLRNCWIYREAKIT